jgi:Xaa-Pro aminopeptidase
MEPSIKRGLTFWDRALMPWDEFHDRVRIIREAMRRDGLQALVVSGNMYDDADLVYIVGGPVDGTLVLTLDGDPSIFTASGSREGFFMRELTWVPNLAYRGPLVGRAVAETLDAAGVASGRIGHAGLQVLTSRPYDDLVRALDGYELCDFSQSLAEIRAVPRPREMTAVRLSYAIAREAAAAGERVFAAGGSNAAALVEAERVARREGAWDVRTLANIESDHLRPFEHSSPDRRPLRLWVAARYQGYWADCTISHGSGPESEAHRALAAMIAAARPDVPARVVADAGLSAMSEASRQGALSYGLGQGIGLRLNGAPTIDPSSPDTLRAGMLLSFCVFAPEAIASAIVAVRPEGACPAEPLAGAGRIPSVGAAPE